MNSTENKYKMALEIVQPCFVSMLKELDGREMCDTEARNSEVTNLEYYKDEILENCLESLAVVKGRPKLCYKTSCNDCDFKLVQKECHNKVKDWLKQPYEKPTYKLTQCEYDMLDTIFEKDARFSTVYLIGELKKKGYFERLN